MSDWTSHGEPRLTRFRFATVGAPDIALVERDYCEWLGYLVRERGLVTAQQAESWGAPGIAGRPYIVMSTEGASEDYIRAVQTTGVAGYRALTTFGWSAFEIIVDDVHAVHERLRKSSFTVLAEPTPAPVHAVRSSRCRSKDLRANVSISPWKAAIAIHRSCRARAR